MEKNSLSKACKNLTTKVICNTLILGNLTVELINLLPTLASDLRSLKYTSLITESCRYNSVGEFLIDYYEEKKKLGIENLPINLELEDNMYTHCKKNKDGTFSAVFCKRYLDPFTTYHELFHIKRMQEDKINNIKYAFIPFYAVYEEWLATSYGIKRCKEKNKKLKN